MHTLAEMSTSGTHVPAFLAKLWKLVDDPTTNDLIYWSESGNSFIIWNQAKFSRDLLPLYYKHNNMASFVRQLNMYGFHKVVSVEQGGLKVDKDEMEFAHPFFLRGQETSLELIKRKIPAAKAEDARIRPDSIQKVLMDVRQMKGRQENMDSKLVTMKRENEALWRELAALRQKHAKQTQIVSKLLQFLVGMMSSSQAPRLGFKRRMPLMLNDFEAKKERKGKQIQSEEMGHEDSATGPVIHDVTEMFTEDSSYLGSAAAAFMEQPQVQSPPASKSPFSDNPLLGGTDNSPLVYGLDPPINGQLDTENGTGEQKDAPTAAVKDVTPQGPNVEITSTASKAAMRTPATTDFSEPQQKTPTTYYLQSADGTVQPVQVVLSIPETPPTTKTQTGSTATNTTSSQGASLPDTPIPSTSFDMVPVIARNQTVDCMSPHFNKKPKYHTDEFDGHLDDMQIGLDNLRDILQNDEYKMDPSMLLGLFGENDLGYSELAKLQNAEAQATNNESSSGTHTNPLIGQELVSYNPSLFELTEEDSQFFDDSTNILLDDELESMLTTEKSKLNKSQTKEESTSVVGLGGGLTTPVGSTPPILGIPSHLSIPTTTIGTSSASGAGKRKRK